MRTVAGAACRARPPWPLVPAPHVLQQYLAKNPRGDLCHANTGDDPLPVGDQFSARCRIGLPLFVEMVKADHWGPHNQQGAAMAEYLIYFNQQWVGDHTEE